MDTNQEKKQSSLKDTPKTVHSNYDVESNNCTKNHKKLESDGNHGDDEDDNENFETVDIELFPGFAKKAFFMLTQESKLRYICLKMVISPYPFKLK